MLLLQIIIAIGKFKWTTLYLHYCKSWQNFRSIAALHVSVVSLFAIKINWIFLSKDILCDCICWNIWILCYAYLTFLSVHIVVLRSKIKLDLICRIISYVMKLNYPFFIWIKGQLQHKYFDHYFALNVIYWYYRRTGDSTPLASCSLVTNEG